MSRKMKVKQGGRKILKMIMDDTQNLETERGAFENLTNKAAASSRGERILNMVRDGVHGRPTSASLRGYQNKENEMSLTYDNYHCEYKSDEASNFDTDNNSALQKDLSNEIESSILNECDMESGDQLSTLIIPVDEELLINNSSNIDLAAYKNKENEMSPTHNSYCEYKIDEGSNFDTDNNSALQTDLLNEIESSVLNECDMESNDQLSTFIIPVNEEPLINNSPNINLAAIDGIDNLNISFCIVNNDDNPDDPPYIVDEFNASDDSELLNVSTSEQDNFNSVSLDTSDLSSKSGSVTPPERTAVTKRKRVEGWERNKIKRLRAEGKTYTSLERLKQGGKIVKSMKERLEKKLGPKCNSTACLKSSKRLCNEISDDDRHIIFKQFWKMNWEERKTYVASLVTTSTTKQKRRIDSGDRRGMTFHYFLNIKNSKKEVCKKTFLNTFSLGEWSVRQWAINSENGMSLRKSNEKSNVDETCQEGGEGCSGSARKAKGKYGEKQFATSFLMSLPKMESHYCRKDTSKLYLEPIIKSGQELYNLYKKKCEDENERPLGRTTFSDLVLSMNISIFQTKKDKCDICCQHEVGHIDDILYKNHIDRKNRARLEKESDKDRAKKGECNVYTIDLQQVKLSPALNASSLYYKSKLCCHNHTYYNMNNSEVMCYWWNESEGELKASNFVSCAIDFLQKEINSWPENKPRHIILWTDGCVYQNKNKTLANAILHLSLKHKFKIEQKFLQKGHTQMEADSVHASIERRLKNREIHLPSDYLAVTREARSNPCQYQAKGVDHIFFRNFEIPEGEIYSSIRPGNFKNDPTVNNLVHLAYSPEGIINYKLNFEDELKPLPSRKKSIHPNPQYPRMYPKRLEITQLKWQNLQDLKPVLPVETHHFYNDLPHKKKTDNKKKPGKNEAKKSL